MGAWQSGDRADRLAALGQVSRSVSVTCAVSDRWSAKILNERGLSLMPCRIGKDAAPWQASSPSPAGVNGHGRGLRPTAVARLRSADLPLATVST